MTRIVGYTRELLAGTGTQDDIAALRTAGATDVFVHDPHGARSPAEGLATLSAGDVVVVTDAARLASTLTEFTATVAALTTNGVRLQVLSEPALCTGGAAVDPGEVMVALSALRTRLVGLRVRAGMATAAESGRRPGRPSALTPDRVDVARELRNQGRSYAQIGRALGVSASAIRRSLTTPNHPAPALR